MSDPVALTSRVLHTIGAVNLNDQFSFYIDVPAGAFLLVETTADSGDVDLFVKRGAVPTTTSYDVKSDGPNAFETCLVRGPVADRYYVLVYGYAASVNVAVRAVSDSQTGTPTSVPVLSYSEFGDPASFFQQSGTLAGQPLLSTTNSQNPLAGFTTHVQSDQGSAEAILQLSPPVFTGLTNQLQLLATFNDAFVLGYSAFQQSPFGGSSSLTFQVPYSNVHAVFAVSMTNPTSPAAGYPNSGSAGSVKAVADTSTSNVSWGSATGQQSYTMHIRVKAVLVEDPTDNGNGTWAHHYVLAVAASTGGDPSYSGADCIHFWANLAQATPLKTFALVLAPPKTRANLDVASFDDPSAVHDPATYMQTLSLTALSANAPPPPPPPPDPFWTEFVGCKEVA